MTLVEKINKIYPALTIADYAPSVGTIQLQNDSDGRGDYIKSWTHPDYLQPTDEQLAGIK